MAESTSEIEERRIVLTESAARRITTLRAQERVEDAFLRIAVSGGGCSGFQYGFTFDDQRNDDDFLFERDGVTVVLNDVFFNMPMKSLPVSSLMTWSSLTSNGSVLCGK